MQLQYSKLCLTDTPIPQQSFAKLIPPSSLTSSQPLAKLELHQLSMPFVCILYGYRAGPQFEGYQLQLDLEVLVKGEKISQKIVSYTKSKYEGKQLGEGQTKSNKEQQQSDKKKSEKEQQQLNTQITMSQTLSLASTQVKSQAKSSTFYICKIIELDSCVCYERPITVLATIKYTESQQQPQQIYSVEELSRQLSTREFTIYSQKCLYTYKRDIVVKEPVSIQYRYARNEGYLWVKCANVRNERVKVNRIYLMNWAIKSEGFDQVRLFASISTLDENEKGIVIGKGQEIAAMLTINSQLGSVEIPLGVEYEIGDCEGYGFKLIKYLFIE